MTSVDDTLADDDYDEFGLLHENVAEWDLDVDVETVRVARQTIDVGPGRSLSYIAWGDTEPEVVFLHGGGQNAHTWDTVAVALGRPAVAVDLPGHGRSYRRDDRNYGPWQNAEALEVALPALAAKAVLVVGMSLGGATTIRLAARRPDLCPRAVFVDVTPQINDPSRALSTVERSSVALITGPPTYQSFDEMADAAIELGPLRAASGVRRGVRHNAYRRADGLWTWRYDLFGPAPKGADWGDFTPLWDDVSRITVPTMFLRGAESPFVHDTDLDEMRQRLPAMRVETVAGAGHAIQSDRPLDLVRLVEDFLHTSL